MIQRNQGNVPNYSESPLHLLCYLGSYNWASLTILVRSFFFVWGTTQFLKSQLLKRILQTDVFAVQQWIICTQSICLLWIGCMIYVFFWSKMVSIYHMYYPKAASLLVAFLHRLFQVAFMCRLYNVPPSVSKNYQYTTLMYKIYNHIEVF